jgi:ribosomal protein L40E
MMISICMYCGAIKSGTEGELSHGICYPCALLFYGYSVPALMKPKATREDCRTCRHRDLDSDGIPDGCGAPGKCEHPDRRDPWGN